MRKEGQGGFDIILTFLHILVQRKKLILWVTGVGTVIAMIIVMLLPKTYQANALIKPPSTESGNPLSSMLGDIGPLSGLVGSFFSTQSGEDDCVSILSSAQFSRKVIEKFDLIKVYKFHKKKKYYMADVMRTFHKKAGYEITDEGAIRIFAKDKSIERARDMVDYMVDLLDSMYIDLQKKTISQKLGYFNERIALAQSDMSGIEDSMVSFQKKNNLYLPELQVKTILEMAGGLEMQIEVLAQEMDLETSLRGRDTPRYQRLALQKRRLEKELRSRFEGGMDSGSLSLPIHVVPSLALEYYRMERSYQIKLTLFKFLTQQVELLKLEHAKNINAISVIDPPWLDDKRVAPRRRLIVQVVFILLLIFTSLAAVVLALWDKHKREDSESYRRVLDIRRELTGSR